MQPADDGFATGTTLLFPAWPCGWDVSFKLHAPMATTVEVDYRGGKLLNFTVTPQSRKPFMVWLNCVSN